MAPATIERRRLGMRDAAGQLALDGLTGSPRPLLSEPRPGDPRPTTAAAPAVPRGGATLDDVIAGVWRDLGAQRVAACPVCGSSMQAEHGARGGSCRACGTTLS